PLVEFLAQAGPGNAVTVRAALQCELSEAEKKEQRDSVWNGPLVVGYGILPSKEKKGEQLVEKKLDDRYVVGRVTGLTVQFDGDYRDAFLGPQKLGTQNADPTWKAAQLARLQEKTIKNQVTDPAPTTGFVSVDPSALGLRRYGLSFNLLAQGKPKTCRV